ncbi:MAG: hypothetical protein K2X74_05700 [Acetobacteraceae bacterium]|nr:hypothetical protein [Acetobacteraceae bacterium]
MLRRDGVDHILRAAAGITGVRHFVVVGTGAAVATQRQLPLAMMLTSELDLYAAEASDPSSTSDLIVATIGQDSVFHRTFGYHADGVGPETAILPRDWRDRAILYTTPAAPDVTALCPSLADLAVSKLCAGREKDRDWLRAAFAAALLRPEEVAALLPGLQDARAPDAAILAARLAGIATG